MPTASRTRYVHVGVCCINPDSTNNIITLYLVVTIPPLTLTNTQRYRNSDMSAAYINSLQAVVWAYNLELSVNVGAVGNVRFPVPMAIFFSLCTLKSKIRAST